MTHSLWTTGRASYPGRKNRNQGTECQDHACIVRMPNTNPDALVATVADGVGSTQHAAIASRTAAQAAACWLTQTVWRRGPTIRPHHVETILNDAVNHARFCIEAAADRLAAPLEQLGTTLMVLIHVNGILATANIGDGGTVISNVQDEYITFSKPQRGEFANQTDSLSSRRALQRCRINIAVAQPPVQAIAMFTDGLANLNLSASSGEAHQPFFNDLCQWFNGRPNTPHWNEQIRDFISSETIQRRTHDDTTLVLALRQ